MPSSVVVSGSVVAAPLLRRRRRRRRVTPVFPPQPGSPSGCGSHPPPDSARGAAQGPVGPAPSVRLLRGGPSPPVGSWSVAAVPAPPAPARPRRPRRRVAPSPQRLRCGQRTVGDSRRKLRRLQFSAPMSRGGGPPPRTGGSTSTPRRTASGSGSGSGAGRRGGMNSTVEVGCREVPAPGAAEGRRNGFWAIGGSGGRAGGEPPGCPVSRRSPTGVAAPTRGGWFFGRLVLARGRLLSRAASDPEWIYRYAGPMDHPAQAAEWGRWRMVRFRQSARLEHPGNLQFRLPGRGFRPPAHVAMRGRRRFAATRGRLSCGRQHAHPTGPTAAEVGKPMTAGLTRGARRSTHLSQPARLSSRAGPPPADRRSPPAR